MLGCKGPQFAHLLHVCIWLCIIVNLVYWDIIVDCVSSVVVGVGGRICYRGWAHLRGHPLITIEGSDVFMTSLFLRGF